MPVLCVKIDTQQPVIYTGNERRFIMLLDSEELLVRLDLLIQDYKHNRNPHILGLYEAKELVLLMKIEGIKKKWEDECNND